MSKPVAEGAKVSPKGKQHCTAHDVDHVSTAFTSPRSRVCKKAARERTRRNSRAKRLWDRYGITLEEYDALLAAQGRPCDCKGQRAECPKCHGTGIESGCCAMCGGKRKYNLHVDHDHELERSLIAEGVALLVAAKRSIRGLLCARCNKLLRDARDNGKLLSAAVTYLANPPARKVLT